MTTENHHTFEETEMVTTLGVETRIVADDRSDMPVAMKSLCPLHRAKIAQAVSSDIAHLCLQRSVHALSARLLPSDCANLHRSERLHRLRHLSQASLRLTTVPMHVPRMTRHHIAEMHHQAQSRQAKITIHNRQPTTPHLTTKLWCLFALVICCVASLHFLHQAEVPQRQCSSSVFNSCQRCRHHSSGHRPRVTLRMTGLCLLQQCRLLSLSAPHAHRALRARPGSTGVCSFYLMDLSFQHDRASVHTRSVCHAFSQCCLLA